jgi:hypothetical protein
MLIHPLIAIALVALIVRICAVVITTSLPRGTFALDDSTYTGMATAKANGEISHWDQNTIDLWDRTSTFTIPLQGIFMLFGPEMWIAQSFVTLWGVAACVLATAIALRLLPAGYALAVGLFVSLLPSQALWSSLVLKDAAVWATLAGLGLLMVLAATASGQRLILLGVGVGLTLYLVAHLREHTLVVAGWALVGAASFGRKDTRVPRLAGALLLAIVMPWLHGWGPGGEALIRDPNLTQRRAANAQGAQSAFVDPDTGLADPETVASNGGDDESGGRESQQGPNKGPNKGKEGNEDSLSPTAEVLDAPRDSVGANLRHLPRGLAVMLFEPIPWRATTSANMALARWETIVWYPMVLLAFIGVITSWRRLGPLAFALMAGSGMLFVYALAEGNIGTAYRHRGEFVWVVALLAGFGLHFLATRWSRRT